ncbi:tetratricopeptide repeat protein [Actinophytocola oryzae]|uniref:Flp pilus assembly protein TadD n=1 Tax=Actinophytocola oryzae TaxID=502181 RepID=A0A4R7W166_9PSEU|nr:tetratricopeptide repeat protein [Actinophytocola oryzae]TDV56280.1 Flp pilus assembly protein TadD [Actinophytocola oryzae]
MNSHLWLVAPWQGSAEPADVTVDCHRRLRGPYTGLGAVLRELVPTIDARYPDLVRRNVIAILSVAPELRGTVEAEPDTLTALAVPTERTRIYPANRTRRHAHSVVELLESYTALAGHETLTLRFRDVDLADHTDQEFLAIALRRARSGRVRLLVETVGEDLPGELRTALDRYARRFVVPEPPATGNDRAAADLVAAYVASDGTTRHPAEIAAYRAADPDVRARLHDERAAALSAMDEQSLRLGAIPYHLEHGTDPVAAGTALLDAANYCFDLGFYHAVLDYGPRGRAIMDPTADLQPYWLLSTKLTTALAATGRSAETEPIYLELSTMGTDPKVHMSCCYALAMMFTRHHPPERRNHPLAKGLLNNSIAMAGLLADHDDRVFFTVFQQNGLALVEMHLGNMAESLRLVSEGLVRLDAELPADKHRLHRSVLVNNRAKVLMIQGRLTESLADLDAVIEMDPNYPDYYFDRADVRRKLGDLTGAEADYDHATTLTPPFWELYYNRADIRSELGDHEGAVADLSYVVELEPGEVDARVNLIDLLLAAEDLATASVLIDEGLHLAPGNARLLHARGLVAQESGDVERARADFDQALAVDASCVVALASRAALLHELDDNEAALADLDLAVALAPADPDLLYNRGFVRQATGRCAEAVADYDAALRLPGADEEELLRRRASCHAESLVSR